MGRIIVDGQEIDLGKLSEAAKGAKKDCKQKERRECFTGDGLEVCSLCADVYVQPSSDDKILVTVNGPANVVDELAILEQNGLVTIKGTGGGTTVVQSDSDTITVQHASGNIVNVGGSVTRIINRMNDVAIGNFGGMTIISGGDDLMISTGVLEETKLKVEILAPRGTEVEMQGVSGEIEIGDLQGSVGLDLSGSSSAKIASAADLSLDLSGKAGVQIYQVMGVVNLDLSGQSKVTILDGQVDKMIVDASGMSEVVADVVAKKANLDASGMSHIRIKAVTGRCRKDSSGMSKIVIG